MVYDFKNLKTGELGTFNHEYVPTGTVVEIKGEKWERLLSAPKYSMAGQWAEQAGTAKKKYSHFTGTYVTEAEERKAEAAAGYERIDPDVADRKRSERIAEEDKLLAQPLPTLTEIINS